MCDILFLDKEVLFDDYCTTMLMINYRRMNNTCSNYVKMQNLGRSRASEPYFEMSAYIPEKILAPKPSYSKLDHLSPGPS